MTKQERIDRLAIEFMKWHRGPLNPVPSASSPQYAPGLHWFSSAGKFAAYKDWNPFASLDDARLLLQECGRRGLLREVACKWNDLFHVPGIVVYIIGLERGLMATAEQQTEAIESIISSGNK